MYLTYIREWYGRLPVTYDWRCELLIIYLLNIFCMYPIFITHVYFWQLVRRVTLNNSSLISKLQLAQFSIPGCNLDSLWKASWRNTEWRNKNVNACCRWIEKNYKEACHSRTWIAQFRLAELSWVAIEFECPKQKGKEILWQLLSIFMPTGLLFHFCFVFWKDTMENCFSLLWIHAYTHLSTF